MLTGGLLPVLPQRAERLLPPPGCSNIATLMFPVSHLVNNLLQGAVRSLLLTSQDLDNKDRSSNGDAFIRAPWTSPACGN